jgi:hypothetical protein
MPKRLPAFPKPEPIPPRSYFRAWLAKHKPREVVGETIDPCECPLARWLMSLGPEYEGVQVGTNTATVYAPKRRPRRLQMTDWMVQFVDKLDSDVMSALPAAVPRRVTAQRCIEVLDMLSAERLMKKERAPCE